MFQWDGGGRVLNADGKPPGGRACGSFGLSRGFIVEPIEPQTATLHLTSLEVDPPHREVRRLLLAKVAERNLATYELNGWADLPARPRRSRRRTLPPRVPTSAGGPVIVCLDTSWSMEGPRETLAKALVVEAVRSPTLCRV